MKVLSTRIDGVFVVDTTPFVDQRGTFERFYCERELTAVIGSRRIVQINHSRTSKIGAVRGLHFQRPPHSEMKLVRCIKGRVWDVAVDLRAGSPTLLQWHAEELSSENTRMIVIPEGCAHGFQVLEAESELLYLSTAFYTPEFEGGIAATEAMIGIMWPFAITELSERDAQHPDIGNNFAGIAF